MLSSDETATICKHAELKKSKHVYLKSEYMYANDNRGLQSIA